MAWLLPLAMRVAPGVDRLFASALNPGVYALHADGRSAASDDLHAARAVAWHAVVMACVSAQPPAAQQALLEIESEDS